MQFGVLMYYKVFLELTKLATLCCLQESSIVLLSLIVLDICAMYTVMSVPCTLT